MVANATHEPMHPEWVILGIDCGPDVMVLGSTKLSHAELTQEWEAHEEYFANMILGGPYTLKHSDLTMRMREFTIVIAPTYAEALQKLFGGGFNPDERKAIDPPQKGLPNGMA